MNKSKLMKLAHLVLNFAEVKTDKSPLIYEGELAVGTEVSVEDENGEIVAAPDGEYTLEDGKVVVVAEGKVAEIKEVSKEETIEEELEEEVPTKDEKDLRIEELEGLLKDRDAVIEELNAKIKELEDKLNAPVEEPLEVKASAQEKVNSFTNIFK